MSVETASGAAASRLRRCLAMAALLLIAVTWRLWIPQTVYPQVPLFGWALDVPVWCEWTALTIALAGLIAALAAPRTHWSATAGLLVFAAGLLGLVIVDQHRLQPWAWEFLLIAVVLASVPPRRALALLRALAIGIYAYSAVSKLDVTFFETHGQRLVDGLLQTVGLSLEVWPETLRKTAAAALPAGELLTAVLLAVPKTRRPGLTLSLLMHGLLLAALGPWGLDHEPGVLLWNLYFVAQNLLLFGPLRRSSSEVIASSTEAEPAQPEQGKRAPVRSSRFASGCGHAVVLVALGLPLLEPFGWFDHWPAWAVYASQPERVRVSIDETDAARLSPVIRCHTRRRLGWMNEVRIDRWSLQTLHAPVYPEDRFQIGVALALAEEYRLRQSIRVVIESPADRRSGERSRRTLNGIAALRNEADRYLCNARPRTWRFAPAKTK